MSEETNKNETQETSDERTPHDDLQFQFSPASLGMLAEYATQKPIDFSWLKMLAGEVEAARATGFSWLLQLAGQVPAHEEMMRLAQGLAAQVQASVAGLEMLAGLIRAVATAEDYQVLSRPAIAGQVLAALQTPEFFRRDDSPVIDASDLEM